MYYESRGVPRDHDSLPGHEPRPRKQRNRTATRREGTPAPSSSIIGWLVGWLVGSFASNILPPRQVSGVPAGGREGGRERGGRPLSPGLPGLPRSQSVYPPPPPSYRIPGPARDGASARGRGVCVARGQIEECAWTPQRRRRDGDGDWGDTCRGGEAARGGRGAGAGAANNIPVGNWPEPPPPPPPHPPPPGAHPPRQGDPAYCGEAWRSFLQKVEDLLPPLPFWWGWDRP